MIWYPGQGGENAERHGPVHRYSGCPLHALADHRDQNMQVDSQR